MKTKIGKEYEFIKGNIHKAKPSKRAGIVTARMDSNANNSFVRKCGPQALMDRKLREHIDR